LNFEPRGRATARFPAFGITSEEPKLADALHVIAREYGFDTWPVLKLHVQAASEDPVEAAYRCRKGHQRFAGPPGPVASSIPEITHQ
jgi:hypothetical protein